MGCHDVVRFGAPQLVVDRLAVQRSRPGATWWDNVCADHADAAVDSDGDALFEVAARFEEGRLGLHTAEALAQGIALLRHDHPGGAVARELHLSDLMHRCGRVRTPALTDAPPLVTVRELEVTRLATGGCSNRRIRRLGWGNPPGRWGTSCKRSFTSSASMTEPRSATYTRGQTTRSRRWRSGA